MDLNDLYPPNPEDVPDELTKLTFGYRKRVFFVLLGILLFVLVYFAMVAGGWYLLRLSLQLHAVANGELVVKAIAIGFSGMLLIFTLKFVFYLGNSEQPGWIELKEKDHPLLFAYVRQLAQDIGTRFPRKIYANSEINAAVFYNNSFWSLVFPTRKNLLIGLPLVNSLDLSGFKSVLAHELGHFSQKSMRLGSYVYTAQRIIVNMVYRRDLFDELIGDGKRPDIRIVVLFWFVYLSLWLIRKILEGLLRIISYLNGALYREMEFHADLVSVRMAGSMGIVHSLYDLEVGTIAAQSTMHYLHKGLRKEICTPDFFCTSQHGSGIGQKRCDSAGR